MAGAVPAEHPRMGPGRGQQRTASHEPSSLPLPGAVLFAPALPCPRCAECQAFRDSPGQPPVANIHTGPKQWPGNREKRQCWEGALKGLGTPGCATSPRVPPKSKTKSLEPVNIAPIYLSLKKSDKYPRKMAQNVRVLAANSDSLGSIPRTHRVKRTLSQVAL